MSLGSKFDDFELLSLKLRGGVTWKFVLPLQAMKIRELKINFLIFWERKRQKGLCSGQVGHWVIVGFGSLPLIWQLDKNRRKLCLIMIITLTKQN